MSVVQDGSLNILTDTADASVYQAGSADACILLDRNAEAGVFMVVREGAYPSYTGATEVTPGQTAVILETANKTVYDNITINPIPSNYGLITWNGSTLTVS